MKFENLKFLEPSGSLQACNGTPLPLVSYTRRLECSARPPWEPQTSHSVTSDKGPGLSPRYVVSDAGCHVFLNEPFVSGSAVVGLNWKVLALFLKAPLDQISVSYSQHYSPVCPVICIVYLVGVRWNSAASATLAWHPSWQRTLPLPSVWFIWRGFKEPWGNNYSVVFCIAV